MRRIQAAGAVVTDAAGRVLLVLRGHEPQSGRWSIPGGRVEPGETHAQAAAREVLEETGLTVRVVRELGVVELPSTDGTVFEAHDFLAEVVSGELRAADDAADARWFAPDELPTLSLTVGLLDWLRRFGVTATP
ncbi:NUDIX hydrolase [Agromyces sp. Marseille-P2726]|uniref:NUDIX hydrolase n=1 Tax=Agromyces sp. Marseille-P2726 TaxID=2709132 RepID=UPI00156E66D0|nr:NUDIX domain-containing protein [Agromyces sp. Marseille-P2726]